MNLDIVLQRLTGLANSTLALLPGLALGLVVFGLFLLVGRLVSAGLTRAVQARSESQGLGIVLGRISYWVIGLLGFLVGSAIAFPSVGAADLFGLLGIGGVAIGFAFRDILQNLLAGILILLTRPFRIGDQIVTGGYEGTVEDIQVRATTIRTYDNRRAVIPNSALFGDKVLVNTAYDKRRLQVRVGIGYGDDIARELESMSSQSDVEAELAALKAKSAPPSLKAADSTPPAELTAEPQQAQKEEGQA